MFPNRTVFLLKKCPRFLRFSSKNVHRTSRISHAAARNQSTEFHGQNPSDRKECSEEYFLTLLYELHPELKIQNASCASTFKDDTACTEHTQVPKSMKERQDDKLYQTKFGPVVTELFNEHKQVVKDDETRQRWKQNTSCNSKLEAKFEGSVHQNDMHSTVQKKLENVKSINKKASKILVLEYAFDPSHDQMERKETNITSKDNICESGLPHSEMHKLYPVSKANTLLNQKKMESTIYSCNSTPSESLSTHERHGTLKDTEDEDSDDDGRSLIPTVLEFEDSLCNKNVNTTHTDTHEQAPSPLSKTVPKFLDEVAPTFESTFNFAAYVNRSESLQQLVKLGVDLSRIERREGVLELFLRLDFEKDMSPHIHFLHNVGVPVDDLGQFITINPLIFKESLEDLAVRIKYLKFKKFPNDAIACIVTKAPFFLSFTTLKIDMRLGFFQKMFSLKGQEVRHLVTRMPKVVISSMQHIREMTFTVKEEMGFTPEETKTLLLNKPKLWMLQRKNLSERFDLIHNQMGIPHEHIVAFPGVLLKRQFLVKQRHLYLKKLQRAQYNPKLPEYVSLKDLVSGTDAEFCFNITKTTVEDFNEFLKTL